VTDAKAALEQHVEQRLGGAQAQLQGTTESAVAAAQEAARDYAFRNIPTG